MWRPPRDAAAIDFHEPQWTSSWWARASALEGIRRRSSRGVDPRPFPRCGPTARRVSGGGGEAESFDIDGHAPSNRSLTADDRHAYYIDWMRPIALLRTTVGCPSAVLFCALWKIMDGSITGGSWSPRPEIGDIPGALRLPGRRRAVRQRPADAHLADMIKTADLGKETSLLPIDSFLRDRNLMEQWHEVGPAGVLRHRGNRRPRARRITTSASVGNRSLGGSQSPAKSASRSWRTSS